MRDPAEDVPEAGDETYPGAALLQRVRGLAHDVNNLLQVAILGLNMDEEIVKREVLPALLEAAMLTREILAVGATPASPGEPLVVAPVVQSAVARLAALLGERITIESRVDAVDARVRIEPTTIHQIVRNLALNAHAAMPEGGHLVVELTESVWDGAEVVQLTLSDDGRGIAEEALAKLGTPQPSSRLGGNGLGLALLKQRLDEVGGVLRVERRPEGGTRATVLLPKA